MTVIRMVGLVAPRPPANKAVETIEAKALESLVPRSDACGAAGG
jgi:hypothetical protein